MNVYLNSKRLHTEVSVDGTDVNHNAFTITFSGVTSIIVYRRF